MSAHVQVQASLPGSHDQTAHTCRPSSSTRGRDPQDSLSSRKPPCSSHQEARPYPSPTSLPRNTQANHAHQAGYHRNGHRLTSPGDNRPHRGRSRPRYCHRYHPRSGLWHGPRANQEPQSRPNLNQGSSTKGRHGYRLNPGLFDSRHTRG
jgi:hypothetical protein